MNLLERMKFSIGDMSMGEKFLASMQVTFLGIGIVFVGLAVLYFAIILMEKLVNKQQPKAGVELKPNVVSDVVPEEEEAVDDTELVAVITAAVAASLHTSTHNIIVRNIARVSDPTPAWAKMGRMEQINNTL